MTDFKNEYCMHTATCGELRKEDIGREVVLTGWAWHNRDHGGIIFCDMRDRNGYVQVIVDPDCVTPEEFNIAEHLSREDVLKVTGKVRARDDEAVNPLNALKMAEAYCEKGVRCSVVIYPHGQHGLSVADDSVYRTDEPYKTSENVKTWIDDACSFMKLSGIAIKD